MEDSGDSAVGSTVVGSGAFEKTRGCPASAVVVVEGGWRTVASSTNRSYPGNRRGRFHPNPNSMGGKRIEKCRLINKRIQGDEREMIGF